MWWGSEKNHPGIESRIEGIKKHRIPDPEHWLWVEVNLNRADISGQKRQD
jgi:hypothetical protein